MSGRERLMSGRETYIIRCRPAVSAGRRVVSGVVFMLFLVVFLSCESAGRGQGSEAKVRVFGEIARIF
jgi:hypothetical protein